MDLPKLKKVTEKKKKKIILLSDDLRMSSGVGTMSREIVMGTIKEYDWVQVAGAIKHPDAGKIVDLNQATREETGIEDAYLKLYPVDGYGSQELLRTLIKTEQPDAILHYTDPRFWGWLYDMEHELRQQCPIFYYNIWDDLPYPRWNEPFYESCDLIMNISKQTHNIVKNVCQHKERTDWDSTYVPHGINEKYFYPVENEKEKLEMNKMKSELFQGRDIRKRIVDSSGDADFDEQVAKALLPIFGNTGLQSVFRTQLKKLDLTLSQIILISSIPIGGIDMTTLSIKIGVDNSTLTRLIDIFIKNGIVKKNKNPKDKRSFIVTVTEKGEFLQSKIELEIESFVTKIFQKTSSVDQEELKKNLSSFHWIVSKYNLNN